MKPAPDLHDDQRFEAARRPDPSVSAMEEHWYFFRALLSVTLRCFGSPAYWFGKVLIVRTRRAEMLLWLRGLEAIARRLLLIAASEDQRPLLADCQRNMRGLAKHPTAMGRERKTFAGFQPDNLPVRFAHAPPPPWTGQSFRSRLPEFALLAAQRPSRPGDWCSAIPIAARLEALIRVLNDPDFYVMQLRQQLARSQGRQANSICTRIANVPRHMSGILREPLAELSGDLLLAARRIFNLPP